MIRELIERFGKEKLNIFTKYPSIPVFHKVGQRNILTDELNVDFGIERVWATEKIDGTNIRILYYGDEMILGSREDLFYYDSSIFCNLKNQFIGSFETLKPFMTKEKWYRSHGYHDTLTVIYGELYGLNLSKASKSYGQSKAGFRFFDVAVYNDLSVLDFEPEYISRWRESKKEGGVLSYGQNFLSEYGMSAFENRFPRVPFIPFELSDNPSHRDILNSMRVAIPESLCGLTEEATLLPEGLILRNFNRTKIAKIRFQDYERTLRLKK